MLSLWHITLELMATILICFQANIFMFPLRIWPTTPLASHWDCSWFSIFKHVLILLIFSLSFFFFLVYILRWVDVVITQWHMMPKAFNKLACPFDQDNTCTIRIIIHQKRLCINHCLSLNMICVVRSIYSLYI